MTELPREDPLAPKLRRHLHESLMCCDSLDGEPWRVSRRASGNNLFMRCPGPDDPWRPDPIVLEALVEGEGPWRQLERDTAKELGLA